MNQVSNVVSLVICGTFCDWYEFVSILGTYAFVYLVNGTFRRHVPLCNGGDGIAEW